MAHGDEARAAPGSADASDPICAATGATDTHPGCAAAAVTAAPPLCGWYGKIASLGDFGARRLPPAFVQRCDDWLSSGLAASREQLGDDWLPVYLNAPLWRFAWSPGLAGPHWWFGVLMPSVDRVGRYFPLIAAQSSPAWPGAPQALAALQAWFDHVADAALHTLSAQRSAADFDARLASAPGWFEPHSGAPAPDLQSLPGRLRQHSAGALDLVAWGTAAGLAHRAQALQGHSLWLAQPAGDARDAGASLSLAPGLPAPQHFSELLRGRW